MKLNPFILAIWLTGALFMQAVMGDTNPFLRFIDPKTSPTPKIEKMPWEETYASTSNPTPKTCGLSDEEVFGNLKPSNQPNTTKNKEITISEAWQPPAEAFASPTSKPGKTFSYEEATASQKAQDESENALLKAQVEHIKALRKDLDSAVSDLKAKWFTRRTKVENYDIIAKTMRRMIAAGDNKIVDEMDSWGLSDWDKQEIFAASSRQSDHTSSLESKIEALTRQNERLRDDLYATKQAAKDASRAAKDASWDVERLARQNERVSDNITKSREAREEYSQRTSITIGSDGKTFTTIPVGSHGDSVTIDSDGNTYQTIGTGR